MISRRELGISLIAAIFVSSGVAFLYDWYLNRTLNLAGICIPKGRILSDRQLIHGALKEAFDLKAQLVTQTYVIFPFSSGGVPIDVTNADIDAFLESPRGKKCCAIVAADDPRADMLDMGQFYAGRFRSNLARRADGNMRAYVLLENRWIDSDKTVRFSQSLYPISNCGALIPDSTWDGADVIEMEQSMKTFPFPRLTEPADYPTIEQTMAIFKPYSDLAKIPYSERGKLK